MVRMPYVGDIKTVITLRKVVNAVMVQKSTSIQNYSGVAVRSRVSRV